MCYNTHICGSIGRERNCCDRGNLLSHLCVYSGFRVAIHDLQRQQEEIM